MRAIILAAGIGSRMGKITEEIPKCLIEINGKPIIRKQVESLNAAGITDISVVTGYREALVKERCKGINIKFYSNPKYKDTGMLESLFCAKNELDDDFFMIYGDVYFERSVAEKLLADKNDYCMVVDKSKEIEHEDEQAFELYHGEKVRKGSTKVFLAEGNVRKISKSLSPEEASAEYIGITKFSKRAAKAVYDRIKYLIDTKEISKYPSPSYLIRWLIEQGEKINVTFVTEDEYAEIDYEHDLMDAERRFGGSKIRGVIFDAEDVIYYRDEETLKPILDFFDSKGIHVKISEFRDAYDRDKLELYKGNVSKDEHLKRTLDHLNVKYDDSFFGEFSKVFRESYSAIKLNEGAAALFERLRQKGIKIAILTDTFASEKKKWEWFARFGLDKFIDIIVCSSETGFTKDQKEAYDVALGKSGLKPEQALFVGHKAYEMEGARKAGVKSVSLEKDIGEDIFVEDVKKIAEIV